jgi:hypothetical protein
MELLKKYRFFEAKIFEISGALQHTLILRFPRQNP